MSAPPRLGRGLSSLLEGASARGPALNPGGTLRVDTIHPGRWQPRSAMDQQQLEELTASVRVNGILQPILVRPIDTINEGHWTHEIIAGERRWRAARSAGLIEVPVIIRTLSDREALAAALIENIQREDLNPLDEARALERLIAEHSLTHDEVAHAVGRSRAAVSNLLRLLELPDEVALMVQSKALAMGHGRALLTLGDSARQVRLARRAVAQAWSVRRVEAEVRREGAPQRVPSTENSKSRRELFSSGHGSVFGKSSTRGESLLVQFADPQLRDQLVKAIAAVLQDV